MNRALQSILFLFIGAMAAGGGAAYFLYQANIDRTALIAQAEDAKRKAEEVAQSGRTVTDEANRKLEEAAIEIEKAKERVRVLEEERAWFAKAERLVAPRTVSTWKEWLNYSHGFSVKLPSNVSDVKNNANGLESPWLAIKPYNDEPIRAEVAYVVDNRLLVGSKDESGWILRVQSGGIVTHLVTLYPTPRVTEKTMMDALATLTFRDE